MWIVERRGLCLRHRQWSGVLAGVGAQIYFGDVSALGLYRTKLGTAISLYT